MGIYAINLLRGYQLGVDLKNRSFELKLDGDLFSRNLVDEAYQDILGRPSDAAGIRRWTASVKADLSERALAQGFFNSLEYRRKKLAPTETVQRLYQFALDREGKPEEVKTWTDRLRQGQTTNKVIDDFYNSSEFKEKQVAEQKQVKAKALGIIQIINRYIGFS